MKKITLTKSITFFIAFISGLNLGFGQMSDLIISEYGEGTSNNKYIEIFNGTGSDINLANYRIWRVSNGGIWPEAIISLTGTLSNGNTYIIANNSANPIILAAENLVSGVVSWNGNDAVGLAKDDGTGTFILIDSVGTDGTDPGIGWDVAGTTNATRDYTLVRKNNICSPNTNWIDSSGTTMDNSEWIVLASDDWSDLGTHATFCCIFISTWSSGAWDNGTPSSSTIAIIDDDFIATSLNSFTACSLIVNSGNELIVANGGYIEIINDVTVNGNLIVQTQGNFKQTDDLSTFTLNGTSSLIKQTATKNAWYYYTYWSSPVVDETVAGAFPDAPGDRRFRFNATNYLDTDGNDIDDDGNDWTIAPGGEVMTPGVGYAATESRFHMPGGTGTASFEGQFNTGNITTDISYNAANVGESWNFIGNPYPGAIDFEAFHAENSAVIGGVAYFWSQASPPDTGNAGNQQQNFSQNDYAMYAVGAGSGVAGGGLDIPNQYIPSAQGFFIEGLDNQPVTFTNAMRMADATSNSLFFKNVNTKSKSTTNSNKLWVNLTSDNGVFNQILVAYVDGATNNDDGSSYDAKRILATNFPATLFTNSENSEKKLAIQSRATRSLNTDDVVKLGFITNIDVATL